MTALGPLRQFAPRRGSQELGLNRSHLWEEWRSERQHGAKSLGAKILEDTLTAVMLRQVQGAFSQFAGLVRALFSSPIRGASFLRPQPDLDQTADGFR
jgi:hypothetical protein